MNMTFSPVRMDTQLTLIKAGDVLSFNGDTLDLSALPNGATLPREAVPCDWIAGAITRDEAGTLTVPVILPHGANAPEETRFPAPLEAVADGDVVLPIYETPEPEPDPADILPEEEPAPEEPTEEPA